MIRHPIRESRLRHDPHSCEAFIGLLEMFSDNEVLLHGAAGEDALDVGDVLTAFRQLRDLMVQPEDARSRTKTSLTRNLTHLERMILGGPPRPEDFGLGAPYNDSHPAVYADYHEAAMAYWRKRASLQRKRSTGDSMT